MSIPTDYLTTPGMASRAAEARMRDFERGPGADRRMAILKELTELEAISQRLRGETIEQYGTVAAARERNKEARASAAIEANGRIEAARIDSESRKKVALIQQEIDELVDKVEGNAEVLDNRLGKIDADRKEGFIKNPTGLYAAGESSNQLVQGYLEGDVKNKLVESINNEIGVMSEPIDKVVFAEGAIQKMSDTVDRDVATMNGILKDAIQKDDKFATPEAKDAEYQRRKITNEQRNAIISTLRGQVSVSDETAAQAKVETAAARKRLDELRKDETNANFLAIPDVANPSDADDIAGMFAGIDDPQALKDQRQRLQDELKTTLTPLGQAHQMMMENNGQFLADLFGFDDTVDAAFYFLQNPAALQQAVQVDSNQSIEEARAELGTNLGIERFVGAAPNVARLRVRATMMGAPTIPEDYRVGFEPEPGVPGAAPLELDEDIEDRPTPAKKAPAAPAAPTAKQAAVVEGRKQAAKIKDPVTADARELLKQGTSGDQAAKNQEVYDSLPEGPIREAYGRSVGIIPTSSFDVSTAKSPPKFVPPDIRDTPEYKMQQQARMESFKKSQEADAAFEKLPESQKKKVAALGKTNTERMKRFEELGGMEGIKSGKAPLSDKEKEVFKFDIAEREYEEGRKLRQQYEANTGVQARKQKELLQGAGKDKPNPGSPGRTNLMYSPTGSATDTFLPKATDNRSNDLARLMEQYGASE